MKKIITLISLSLILGSVSGVEVTTDSSSSKDSMIAAAGSIAGSVAEQIDWEKLSWEDLAGIPYSNKDELVNWALGQANKWKGPLAEATKKQGLNALSSLGSSGWQGYLKTVMDGIEGVKDSSPETYEMSKNALIGAWEVFEKEANKYLKKG